MITVQNVFKTLAQLTTVLAFLSIIAGIFATASITQLFLIVTLIMFIITAIYGASNIGF